MSAYSLHCRVTGERKSSRGLQGEKTSDADADSVLLGAAGHRAKRQRDHEADCTGELGDALANAAEDFAMHLLEHDAADGQCEQSQCVSPCDDKSQDAALLGQRLNDRY